MGMVYLMLGPTVQPTSTTPQPFLFLGPVPHAEGSSIIRHTTLTAGITLPTALAAPVLAGMMFDEAHRPARLGSKSVSVSA